MPGFQNPLTSFPAFFRATTYRNAALGRSSRLITTSEEENGRPPVEPSQSPKVLDPGWFQRYDEMKTLLEQKEKQNKKLLADLQTKQAKLVRLQEIFSIRRAIEHSTLEAEKRQKHPIQLGVQAGLNRLARRDEFKDVLKTEAVARSLQEEEIMACFKRIYQSVAKHSNGHNNNIVIRASPFTLRERAALAVLFKVQDKWPSPFSWREDK